MIAFASEKRPAGSLAEAPAAPVTEADSHAVVRLAHSEIFRNFQQAFENLTGLPLALGPAGAFSFPLRDSRKLNPFCALMARRSQSCAGCLSLQKRLEEEATHGPRSLVCAAGLTESAVPVRLGMKLLGYLRTGQVLLKPPTKTGFARLIRTVGWAPAASESRDLEAAYFQTRVVPGSQYESIVRLLVIFSEHLAVVSNQALVQATTAERPAITKARAFIARHQAEDLRLRDVATAVNVSAFYFCKLFKGTTGFTFTNYLARVRIQAAREMLLHTHVRVTEAAFSAGFQSLSQFNRVFRRVTGETASDFRRRLPGSQTSGAAAGRSNAGAAS